MHIALIGPTGFVGTPLLNELLQRGHRVTALARDPAKLAPRDGLTVVQADATDDAALAHALAQVGTLSPRTETARFQHDHAPEQFTQATIDTYLAGR